MNRKPNYRIYALILGQILQERSFLNCRIAKMSLTEQIRRKFSPIKSTFKTEDREKNYTSYAKFLPYIDPIYLKSQYVISFDSFEDDSKYALGDALRNIEKVCRYLTIALSKDIGKKHGEGFINFYPYLYQVVKIYKLDSNENEKDFKFEFTNNTVMYPLRPEKNSWMDDETETFLEEMFKFIDPVFDKALKYLYGAKAGVPIIESPEKKALDHFKSMEVIINNLSSKDTFKDRLDETATILKLEKEDQETIERLWGERSNDGDIAHSTEIDRTEFFPSQIPLPSNVQYTGLMSSVAPKLLLKYYEYKKNMYTVTIEKRGPTSDNGIMGIVNPNTESNHYFIFTHENDKRRLRKLLISSLANQLNIEEKQIVSYKLVTRNQAQIQIGT